MSAVSLAVAALAGCGSGAGSGADAGAPLTASAFCEQERAQTAAFNARCFGGATDDWKALRDAYVPCARYDDMVKAGTLRYHRELALDCLASNSAERECAAPENFCFTKTLEGLLPPGAACTNDYECPGNAGCWAPGEFGANACGDSVCVLVGAEVGDPCTEVPFCYPGVVTCFASTCVAYGAAGAACGASEPECGPGLRCDGLTLTCAAIADANPCAVDTECLGTQYCSNGQCAPRLALGASCANARNGCVGFAACDPDSLVCVAAGHVGQACGAMTGSPILCIAGSCMDNGDGTSSCRALLADGEACSIGAQCVSGGCDPTGRCAACK